MKEDKNIDKVFREKLEGFKAEPPAYLWGGIQGQLAAQRRKKRLALYSWVAVAALLFLAFVAGWHFSNNRMVNVQQTAGTGSEVVQEPVPGTEEEPVFNRENTGAGQNESPGQLAEATVVRNIADAQSKEERGSEVQTGRSVFTGAGEMSLRKIERIEVNFHEKEKAGALVQKQEESNKLDFSDAERKLLVSNARIESMAAKEESGWKMGVNVAPGYSSYTSGHSENYAQNMTYASGDGSGNVGGGFSVQYKTGTRWSVESGVYYAKSGQKSHNSLELFALRSNADYAAAPERAYLNTAVNMADDKIAMNSTAGIIEFNELPKGSEIVASPESYDGFSNALLNRGEFSQVFDFVEIPFYLRYLVVDSEVDIELLGGVNAGLVVGNNAYMENEYGLQNIGKTKDVLPMNLSGTVGVGMNYALGKHISLAVEPRFSYYLNSINRNPEVEFRPYRMGVYTGLYYDF